jgi:hypothetical protein
VPVEIKYNDIVVAYLHSEMYSHDICLQTTELLRCDKSRSRCVASSVSKLYQDSTTHSEEFQRSTESFSANSGPSAASHSPSGRETVPPNTLLLFPYASKNTDLASHVHKNKTPIATTNTYLQITIPNTSSEGDYANEYYDGDDEYEVYDLKDSLSNYTDTKCIQKGLQCADKTTIMDCIENSIKPLFVMSCTSILHSDNGENATGHCDNETLSCILSSQGMSLSLSIKTINNKSPNMCESYSGLQCIDNETLVACSGDVNSTHYAVSCDGAATSVRGNFLRGHCYDNSCMFVTIHESNNSDIQTDQSENYETYHLSTPDANTNSASNLSAITNTTDIQKEQGVLIQQVEVLDLYDEHEALQYSLSKAEEEYFADDHNKFEAHTVNSSDGGNTNLTTNKTENILHTAQDDILQTDVTLTSAEGNLPPSNTTEPDIDLELDPPHTKNFLEVTHPGDMKIYSETPALNLDHISVASETNVNVTIPDWRTTVSASQTKLSLKKTITQVSATIPTIIISSAPQAIPIEITTPVSKSIPRETLFSIPETTIITVSSVPESIPTETMAPVSKSIPKETAFLIPETTPTDTTTPAAKSIPKETASFFPETQPTETTMPVSRVINTETISPVPETMHIETMTPFSKPIPRETAFSDPKSLPTETMTSVSKEIHLENISPIPETIPTEIMTLFTKPIPTEIAFSVPKTVPINVMTPETAPTENMSPVSKSKPTETVSSVHETLPAETKTPISKLITTTTSLPVPEILFTETMTSVSKPTSTETVFPVPQIKPDDATHFNSETTLSISETTYKEDITPESKPIPILSTHEADGDITELYFNLQALGTDPTVQLSSEATNPLPTDGLGYVNAGTISPPAKMNQSEHLASQSRPAMKKPWQVSGISQDLKDLQKYVCRKMGIQCVDNVTLAACLPDLTLSYTVSCQTLLPFVMSEHHIVYCNYKSDTCALAPLG